MQFFGAKTIRRLPALIIGDQVFIGGLNNPNVLLDKTNERWTDQRVLFAGGSELKTG